MEVFQPTPEQVSPTPASPMQRQNDGVSSRLVQEALANIVRTEPERQRAWKASLEAMQSPAMTKIVADVALALKGFDKQLEGISGVLRSALGDIQMKDFQSLIQARDAQTQGIVDLISTLRMPLPEVAAYIPPSRPYDFPVAAVSRSATTADVRRLEDRIADLEQTLHARDASDQEMRQRVVETHLRTEQMHRHFVPPEEPAD